MRTSGKREAVSAGEEALTVAAGPPSRGTESALPLDLLQGNVLRGYSFPVACFSFVRLLGDAAEARTWLAGLANEVTPGTRWQAGSKPETTLNLAFSHAGLQALGLPASSLDSFPRDFREGMPAQAGDLGDVGPSAPAFWDFGGEPGEPIHVLLSVYAASQAELDRRLGVLKADFGSVVKEQYQLSAAALAPDPRREHFGFRDGFGQPSIEGAGVEVVPGQGTAAVSGGWTDVKAGEFLLGWDNESGFPGPLPQPAELGKNGTFLVFRKLHQDVASFRRFLRERTKQLFGSDTEAHREWLASRLVGRWRSGAPVALSPDRDDPTLSDDWSRNLDFDYRDDPFGASCPVGSHIRRVNPRAGLPPHHLVRTHRILRRGLPYGPPLAEGAENDDGVERGVAFMALNASIESQFRFIQKVWMNDGDFAGSRGLSSAERDPLATVGGGKFVCFDAQSPKSMFDLPRFVRMRGGGYFFVPSLPGLRFLAHGAAH
jgi:Dyp-type peroxidase family